MVISGKQLLKWHWHSPDTQLCKYRTLACNECLKNIKIKVDNTYSFCNNVYSISHSLIAVLIGSFGKVGRNDGNQWLVST